jgi:hypothetical protein
MINRKGPRRRKAAGSLSGPGASYMGGPRLPNAVGTSASIWFAMIER